MCVALFWNQASAQTPADGRRPYQTRCAGCHGEDGTGGGHGPGIVDVRRPRAASKNEVRDLILKGIPDGGMPPFQIPIEEADAIAAFVMTLKTPVDGTVIREKTLMPKVEATAEETRDLVAYLSRLAVDPNSKAVLATREIGAGVRFADIAGPKPGTWPTYDGNLSGNRFSPLKQIDTSNVAQLAPKWMFSIPGARRALEVTPVVVDSVMYVTSVNEAYALDARSGREIWHYSRPRSQGLAGDAAGGINRGVAVLGDRVFMVSDNAHLFALHRFTGRLIWDVEMADSRQNYGSTSAPLVVNDLVIAGVSGGDEGIRGFLDAYSASTGERVWRFWTIPAPGEPGSETWSGRALEHGCGATWLTGTYDPETRLLYWPTGNPCPDYNGDERKGDNLYTASILALDPAVGKLKWYYQFTPHDLHDWDATETPVLVDAQFRGQPRKLHAPGQPKRILLCAGPRHRQGSVGRALCQEDHLGQRYRSRWPAHVTAGE